MLEQFGLLETNDEPNNVYKVYGTVRGQFQEPLQKVNVAAFDKDIRDAQELGNVFTDSNGYFEIIYTPNNFSITDKLYADIFLQVTDANGTLLKTTDIYFNAPGVLEINVSLSDQAYSGPSEFEQVSLTIQTYAGEIPFYSLAENEKTKDISFLMNKTGLAQEKIVHFIFANQYEQQTRIDAAAFYGFLREKLPSDIFFQLGNNSGLPVDSTQQSAQTLGALRKESVPIMMQALKTAILDNIIPYSITSDLQRIEVQLQQFVQSDSGNTSFNSYQIMNLVSLTRNQKRLFDELYNANYGREKSLWEKLHQHRAFKGTTANALQAAFQLSALAQGHLPFAEKLLKTGKIKSANDLQRFAAYNPKEWQQYLKKNKIAPPVRRKKKPTQKDLTAYAQALSKNFEKAFPTAVFKGKLQKEKSARIPFKKELIDFFDQHPSFDLLHSHVGLFLNRTKTKKKSASGSAALTDHLRKIQRIFKLAPNYETTQALLNDNIHSAKQIYYKGKSNFLKKYSAKLGQKQAEDIFRKAKQQYAASLALAGNLQSLSSASNLKVLPDYKEIFLKSGLSAEFPSLQTLFGKADFCECEECRSVYGAASYLTDVLRFLSERISITPGKSVKDVLFERRPDIGDIDLNCDNTNTLTPYIDIANEILENFIAAPAFTINLSFLPNIKKGLIDAALLNELLTNAGNVTIAGISQLTDQADVSDVFVTTEFNLNQWIIRDEFITLKLTQLTTAIEIRLLPQTHLSSAEIIANPEYTNTNAYAMLASAQRPFSLPFDLSEKEGDAYLQKLGVQKYDLIDAFRKQHEVPSSIQNKFTDTDYQFAYAYLGVNHAEQKLIFESDSANQNIYWTNYATISEVDIFLQVTGLAYEDLLTLLTLQFINPLQDSVIIHDDLSCDTDKKHISNLSDDKLDSIHRFLRLWRKTNVTLQELDACIMSKPLGNGILDNNFSVLFQNFLQLKDKLSLSVMQLLAFYQNLDTNGSDSLYNQLFQNKSVISPLNLDFAVSNVIAPVKNITDDGEQPVILAALGIESDELTSLLGKTDNKLSLENLSFIYRNVTLAQSLSLSVADFLTASDLINQDAFIDPVATSAFLNQFKMFAVSSFSIRELDYVLRQQDSDGSFIPDDNTIATDLLTIRTGLQAVQTATSVADDPKGDLLTKWLQDTLLNWDQGIASRLIDILNTTDDTEYQQKLTDNNGFLLRLRIQYHDAFLAANLFSLPAISFGDDYAMQIKYDTDKMQLRYAGYMSNAVKTDLLSLSGITDYKNAVNQLFAASQLTDGSVKNIFFSNTAAITAGLGGLDSTKISSRFAFFLNKISPVYQNLKEVSFIQTETSALFKADKTVAAQLLVSVPAIFSDFTKASFVSTNKAIDAIGYPAQFNRYLLTSKIIFVANKLNIDAYDLDWLIKNHSSVNMLDLLALPTQTVNSPVTDFDDWRRLINLYKLNQYYPPVSQSTASATTTISVLTILQDVIDAKSLNDIETDLVTLTGWSQTEADYLLVITNPLQLILNDDLKDVDVLLRLYRAFSVSAQFGVPLATCITWTSDQLQFTDTQNIKQALKAKYDDSQWLGVTQPLQDDLRQSKRDALVAYILANPGSNNWADENDLYSYFLIDVEMNSCQTTSRIVQANSSVQLFVQRCLMNLEPEVIANADTDSGGDEDWLQWSWMQNYRLWEANRQVFLYPENWIEPDLLPSKSSFFSDLENELVQNEVTKDTAETAFQNYLVKLDGVARLEVKGMWYQDDEEILHVFARTYGGDPKIYYYRQFQQNRTWTPWEKVDLDINSDHIVPIVFNKRRYLFWPVFTEKSEDADSINKVPNPGDTNHTVQKPNKYLQIQMAFSEYQNGKWTPKKVSNDLIDNIYLWGQDVSGNWYKYSPDKANFVFIPLDLPDALAFLKLEQQKVANGEKINFIADLIESLQENGNIIINCYLYDQTYKSYSLQGTFELDPCRGYPVLMHDAYTDPRIILFDNSGWQNMLDSENAYNDALSLISNYILQSTPSVFRNLLPLQMGFFDKLFYFINSLKFEGKFYAEQRSLPVSLGTFMPYFYQDKDKTYYVAPELGDNISFEFFYSDLEELWIALLEQNTTKVQELLAEFPKNSKGIRLLDHFYNFYHPFTCYFMRQLFAKDIEGFISRDTQLKGDVAYDTTAGQFNFQNSYSPTPVVFSGQPVTYPNGITDNVPGYPKEDVDFNPKNGYALYNWELFFHAPLLIAEQLDRNQQFDEANRWYNFIFNPTDTSANPSPQKYWVTKPFFETTNDDYVKERIENLMLLLNSDPDAGEQKELEDDVADWRTNPYQPHKIAQYRTVAYQKTTVMKYLNHLIAYGDYLFRQDTMESVNEATQLYVMASEILGPKPQLISPSYTTPDQNFYQLEKTLDAFSNALVEIENILPLQEISGYDGTKPTDPKLPALETLYFCIPMNDTLLGYWDTIDDRLFKIRNCLNIEGIYAPLALFAPPIDPGMLVRAAASGLDFGSILNDLNAPLPYYRFSVMVQKAAELCNEVKSLGTSLLSALEKKDAEALALLRSSQEINVQQAIKIVKQKQIDDAQTTLEGLTKSKELDELKINYYRNLIAAGLNAQETTYLALTQSAIGQEQAAVIIEYLANVLSMIPNFSVGAAGFGGSPEADIAFGGQALGSAMRAEAGAIRGMAGIMHSQAGVSSTQGSYARRSEEWKQQLDLATKELEQIDKQIAAAQIRIDIANQELQNQQLAIDNAQKVDDFMHGKYTNQDLYNWMITQISTVFFEGYNLAFDVAKRAERCFRYELALADSAYINYGYWDSLKKGLLSGEKLMFDIKQMEMAYFEQNKREYELTKHISLAMLDPLALLKLKQNGTCFINLPEEIFDMDYPSHYMRRIKSVSLSIPCVAGPFTTVSCTLTLTKNSMRVSSIGSGTYARKTSSGLPADDNRFRDNISTIQSIATSQAQNDTGLFELNFRDERYLPFEGAGAITSWQIQLPAALRQFDYQTISDVIIHLKYTSREGGELLKTAAEANLLQNIKAMSPSAGDTGLFRAFSARQDFPTEWYAFLNPVSNAVDQVLAIDITNRFPFYTQGKTIKVTKIQMIADCSLAPINNLQVLSVPAHTDSISLTADGIFGSLLDGLHDYGSSKKNVGAWTIKNPVANARLTSANVKDLILIFYYELS